MKYIVDIKGEIEGDYEIIGRYEERPQGDLISREALKKDIETWGCNDYDKYDFLEAIDNAPAVEPCYQTTSCLDCKMYDKEKHNCPRFCEVIRSAIEEKPQGECKGCEYLKDCETCEDKAKQYSLGFQDGYLLGGFQLTELRRWLIAQGYSEGTVDDKIEDFGRFVKRVREDEG